MKEKILSVSGMYCTNCENRIESRLKEANGVIRAEASYAKGTLDVKYDEKVISLNEIKGMVNSLDYSVKESPENSDIINVIGFVVIIVSLYILLQQLGILNLLVPSRLADSSMGYFALFITGLLTSFHCIAMCGGINLSQSISADESSKKVLLPSLLYNTGRVVSYTMEGFILGGVGSVFGLAGSGVSTVFQGVLKLIAGLIMVIMGVNMLGIFPLLRRLSIRLPELRVKSSSPFIVGLANGLMPCGPLQSVQILALASGSAIKGGISMLLFSLGTVPLMLGLGSIVSVLGKKFARQMLNIGAVLVVVLGCSMLSQGGNLSGLITKNQMIFIIFTLAVLSILLSIPFKKKYLKPIVSLVSVAVIVASALVFPDIISTKNSFTAMIDGDVQVVETRLASGGYPNITVYEGIPVKWTIHAEEKDINGCNYRMIVNDLGITHDFTAGENIIEFTPVKTGAISYSCWMGMIDGKIIVKEP